MKIAIVAATEMELTALRELSYPKQFEIFFYVHEVGILAATYHLQCIAQTHPDYIIQVGIAGVYNTNFSIGSAVAVLHDIIEQGAEDKNEVLSLVELNLLQQHDLPYKNGLLTNHLIPVYIHLPLVNALTVNISSGMQATIERRIKKYKADIETMEGACLHYVCLMEKIAFIQIRGISNKVEVRNKDNWQIQAALASCHHAAHQFIHQLNIH